MNLQLRWDLYFSQQEKHKALEDIKPFSARWQAIDYRSGPQTCLSRRVDWRENSPNTADRSQLHPVLSRQPTIHTNLKTGVSYGDAIRVSLGAHFLNFGDVLYT